MNREEFLSHVNNVDLLKSDLQDLAAMVGAALIGIASKYVEGIYDNGRDLIPMGETDRALFKMFCDKLNEMNEDCISSTTRKIKEIYHLE